MLTDRARIEAAARMQAYIEAHLGERITMAALARAARYSQWHAARVFREATGKPPFEYIRLRRLSAAAETLQAGPRKVVDVAFDFVFDSHEGFSRAFARQFGMSPQRFRTTGAAVRLFMPRHLGPTCAGGHRTGATMSERRNDTVFVQVLDRPARKLIVKRGVEASDYFAYCEEVGCDVWDRLAAIPNALQEPLGLWLPAGLRPPGTSEYVQGVEVAEDFDGIVPDGFEITSLPACKMMVFQGPPFDDADFERAITSLWAVMDTYRPETYGFAWADGDGPRFQLRPEGYRGYIEGRPVRAV